MIRTPSNRSDAEIGKATRDIGLLMGGVKKNLITTEQDFIAAAADMSPWMASMIRSAMESPELHRRVLPEGSSAIVPFPERPLSPGETATLSAAQRLESELAAVPLPPQSPRAKTPEPEDRPVLDFLSARQDAMKRKPKPATGAMAPRGVQTVTIQGQNIVRTEVLPRPSQPFKVHSIPVRERSPADAPPAKRPKTGDKTVHDTRVVQIIQETIPTPASNDSQQEMNEIALKSKTDALERVEIQQRQQNAAVSRLKQRVRSRSASLRRRQDEHDTAAAIAPDPSLEISEVERSRRRSKATQEAIDAELEKLKSLGQAVMTREELELTDAQRDALYSTFNMNDMPSADKIREIQAGYGRFEPETPETIRKREDDVRRLEDVERTAAAVEQGRVQRTEAGRAVTSAGVESERIGADVATEAAAVESARKRAADDKRADAIQTWKSKSILDSTSRRLPPGVESSSELESILKRRKKLWRSGETGAGGRRVTSTTNDFDKWLTEQSDSKVLTRAKSSYRDLIGTFEPSSVRGKSLHRSLADRISRIERRIKGIRSGSIQISQLSASSRSRSRDPQDVPKKKKKRKFATTGESVPAAKKTKLKKGTGFSKKRKKVNEPSSVSRYFI